MIGDRRRMNRCGGVQAVEAPRVSETTGTRGRKCSRARPGRAGASARGARRAAIADGAVRPVHRPPPRDGRRRRCSRSPVCLATQLGSSAPRDPPPRQPARRPSLRADPEPHLGPIRRRGDRHHRRHRQPAATSSRRRCSARSSASPTGCERSPSVIEPSLFSDRGAVRESGGAAGRTDTMRRAAADGDDADHRRRLASAHARGGATAIRCSAAILVSADETRRGDRRRLRRPASRTSISPPRSSRVVAPERDDSVTIALAGAPILRAELARYTAMMAFLFPLAVLDHRSGALRSVPHRAGDAAAAGHRAAQRRVGARHHGLAGLADGHLERDDAGADPRHRRRARGADPQALLRGVRAHAATARRPWCAPWSRSAR